MCEHSRRSCSAHRSRLGTGHAASPGFCRSLARGLPWLSRGMRRLRAVYTACRHKAGIMGLRMRLSAACAVLSASRSHEAGMHRDDVWRSIRLRSPSGSRRSLRAFAPVSSMVHSCCMAGCQLTLWTKVSCVREHLARPCIAKAPALLARLAGAAGVDLAAVRWSVPALAQQLGCLSAGRGVRFARLLGGARYTGQIGL